MDSSSPYSWRGSRGGSPQSLEDSLLPSESAWVEPGHEANYLDQSHGAAGRASPGRGFGTTWPGRPSPGAQYEQPSPEALSGTFGGPRHHPDDFPSPRPHQNLSHSMGYRPGPPDPTLSASPFPDPAYGRPGQGRGPAHSSQGQWGYSAGEGPHAQTHGSQPSRTSGSLEGRFAAAAAADSSPQGDGDDRNRASLADRFGPGAPPQPSASSRRPAPSLPKFPPRGPRLSDSSGNMDAPVPSRSPETSHDGRGGVDGAQTRTAWGLTAEFASQQQQEEQGGSGMAAAPPARSPREEERNGLNDTSASASYPFTPGLGTAVYGQAGGHAVRHVVDELRTSPLVSMGGASPGAGHLAETTPPRRSAGGGGGAGAGAGAGHVGSSGGAGDAKGDAKYQAQIRSLERQNAELQRRLTELQAALEAAQEGRRAVEAKQDALRDQAAEAAHVAKARETALEAARAANDALSGELRSTQEELAAAQDRLAASKDTAVQWQGQALDAGKELEAAKRKIDALGEEERRLSGEAMALRKEVQQLNDAIIKGRIEVSELREKLRQSLQDTARHASAAQAASSRADSETEGAAVQLTLLRQRMAELEVRNAQLVYELATARDEAARARQEAVAVRAARAAKPVRGGDRRAPAGPRRGQAAPAAAAAAKGAAAAAGGAAKPAGVASDSGSGSRYGARPPGGGGGNSNVFAPPPASQQSRPAAQSSAGSAQVNLRSDVPYSKLDDETFRSMVRAEAEALSRNAAAASAAAERPSSPPYPSYGNGGGGGGQGDVYDVNASSWVPAYDRRPPNAKPYEGTLSDIRAYDESNRTQTQQQPYGQNNVRESLVSLLPDPRGSYIARGTVATAQQYGPNGGANGGGGGPSDSRGAGGYGGGGGGGYGNTHEQSGGNYSNYQQQQQQQPTASQPSTTQPAHVGSPPPPYATHTADGSYAYRRPSNAVGAGAVSATGGGGAHGGTAPFGTEETTKDLLARSKAMEDQLMMLCAEKGNLEAEYARMPLGAGRNLRERNRKAVVEQRLELINKDISGLRMQLRKMGVK